MTSRQILIGLAYIGQMIDLGDRDLQATSVDQAGKFCKYLGIRRRAVALRLDAVFRGRREVDDRIDPIGRDTEFERQIHIAAAERVDEGIDFASGCGADPIRDAFPISDWDHTVLSEPGMVCCAGETDDLSAENFGQLDSDGANATCRTRDDNGVSRLPSTRRHAPPHKQ